MHACLQYLCSGDVISEKALRKALTEAGISMQSFGSDRQGPVICFFDDIDHGLRLELLIRIDAIDTRAVFAVDVGR